MLDTLRRIIQEVNSAPDLQQALDIIVQRVRESVRVDVASVYLKDADGRTTKVSLDLSRSSGIRLEFPKEKQNIKPDHQQTKEVKHQESYGIKR